MATPETEERLLAVGRAGTAEHVERIVRGWRRVDRQAEAREADPPARRAVRSRVSGRRRHGEDPRAAGPRGRGVLMQGAGRGPRGAVSAAARAGAGRRPADDGAAAGGRAGAAGGDGAPPRPRSRRPGRALPGGGPRRCRGAGRPRAARPVGARGRRSRSRGNVPAPGVRRQPGGDAPRRRGAPAWRSGPGPGRSRRRCGGRSTTATAAAASRAAGSASARAITSVTGPMEGPPRSRISPCSVVATTAPSTRRATRWIGSRTASFEFRRPDGRALPEVPPPPWVPADPVAVLRAAERGGRAAPHANTGDPGLAGRAARRGLRDRRLASAGPHALRNGGA